MHKKEIAADLRSARRLSGLTNRDVACLLGVDGARISRLETGVSEASGGELSSLSLVYGKAFDDLLPCTSRSARSALRERLAYLPASPLLWASHETRQETIASLRNRLQAPSSRTDEGA